MGGSLTSSLHSTIALNPAVGAFGRQEVEDRRQTINQFMRTSGVFDSVADFDAVTVDTETGELRPEYQANSTTATIDLIHPNRAGYLAMSEAVDINALASAGAAL